MLRLIAIKIINLIIKLDLKKTTPFDVIIVGGGLAGLTNAIHLSKFKQNSSLLGSRLLQRNL